MKVFLRVLCALPLVLALLGLVGEPLVAGPGGSGTDNRDEEKRSVFDAFAFTGQYTGEFLSNVKGGASRGSEYLGMIDVSLEFDGDALLPWRGGRFFMRTHQTHGGSISRLAGDIQGVSNIEASRDLRVFEGWFEQRLWDEKFSLLAGIYDINSEFDSIESAQIFVNSSHGIGPEFALSGSSGPSIFPITRPAIRARLQPWKAFSFTAAIADSPASVDGVRHRHDGALATAEIGIAPSRFPFRGALGFWSYSEGGRFERLHGCYAYAEGKPWGETMGESSLSVYLRLGESMAAVSPVERYVGSGIVWRHEPSGRSLGLGLAVAGAARGSTSSGSRGRHETAIELTFRFPVREWLVLQPDLQYIIDPGLHEPQHGNALILGGRFDLLFWP